MGKYVNVINIKTEMHSNTSFNISPEAVNEYALMVVACVEKNTKKIEDIAKADGRKTILDRDVIQFFGLADSSTAGEVYDSI